MQLETIKKALEYKEGHFNLVQYILKNKPNWTISVISRETYEIVLDKSKDYDKIRKAIKDEETEITIFNYDDKQNRSIKIGWAWFIPFNGDEDVVSDFSNTLTLNAWSKQFEELHEQLNK